MNTLLPFNWKPPKDSLWKRLKNGGLIRKSKRELQTCKEEGKVSKHLRALHSKEYATEEGS